jgi:methylmalonyl-CoA mutase N-terminal domain/subunit
VVGVNQWASGDVAAEDTLTVNPSLRFEQCRFLDEVKAGRDQVRVRAALSELKKAAASDGPLMEHLLAGVEAYATVGELSDVFRDVWGEYRQQVVL